MDWLILIVGVPAILVPLVLLFGFAGCLKISPICTSDADCPVGTTCVQNSCVVTADDGDPDDPDDPDLPPPPPSPPENLVAVALDDHSVFLAWTNTEPGASVFKIERSEEDGNNFTVLTLQNVSPAGTTDDSPELQEGVTYLYRVSVLLGQDVSSAPTNPSSVTVLPATPANFGATVSAIDRIDFSWTNVSAVATELRMEHRVPGGAVEEFILPDGATTFSHDPGLDGGTQHEYRLFAVISNGFENDRPQEVRSAPAVVLVTLAAAFSTPLGAQANDQPGLEGFCVIQRLSPSLLAGAGNQPRTQLRMLLRGSTTGSLTIDRITVSQVGNTGDPYDAAPDLTDVTPGVTTTIAPNATATIGPVNYALDSTKELLVAFDISATANEGNLRFGTLVGNDTFSNPATAEAGVPDRTTGYTISVSLHGLIEIIQVF